MTPTASTNRSLAASSQLPVGEARVKRHVSKNSSWRKSRRNRNNVVRSRRRHGQRRKGWVTARRRRRRSSQRGNRKGSISDNGTSTYTAKNESNFHGSNGTKNVTSKMKNHPCNSVHSPEMKFMVGNMECRRWQKSDLKKRMNCMGNFNHQYLATSFQKALQFKDLDTGKNLDFRKSFVLNHPQSFHHRKRNPDIEPGETLIGKCHGRKTLTESGHLRICPVCVAITRQPSTPKRFPEYINELLCDPQMEFNYLPRINAFCVQKTFTIKLLQFDGDWELNSALSAEAGHDVYTEKWEDYTQTIRHHCACELLPSSPMADLL